MAGVEDACPVCTDWDAVVTPKNKLLLCHKCRINYEYCYNPDNDHKKQASGEWEGNMLFSIVQCNQSLSD